MGKCSQPIRYINLRQRCNLFATWQFGMGISHQMLIAFMELGRTRHAQLRYQLPVFAIYRCIIFINHMQNHRIVGRILVVMMSKPITRLIMYLDISGPRFPIEFNLSIEKVGAGIGIEPPGINHLNNTTIGGAHILLRPQSMLPHILHQFFHLCSV